MNPPETTARSFEEQFRKCALHVALFSIIPFLIVSSVNVLDADLWWHLRAGEWMVQHRAVLHADLFSWTGMGKSWSAYSWLFELIVYGFFARFGLVGILAFTYLMLLAIAVSLYSLVRQFEQRLSYSVGLTALALVAMTRVSSPRPWLFSILCICLELNILVHVRKSGKLKALIWLLPVFSLWANTHIQFVYGFCILGAALVEDAVLKIFGKRIPIGGSDLPIPGRATLLAILGCFLATLINPYHIRIYSVIVETFHLGGLYDLISELQAIPFRSLPDWLVLALVLGAAYALGRKANLSAFWLLTFAGSIFISFRGLRDAWFVVIVATTILARAQEDKQSVKTALTAVQVVIIALATLGILALTVSAYRVSNPNLEEMIAKSYPARAAEFVEKEQLPGPLFNHSNWGGYLVWRLPELPVSIDGRSNIHDAEELRRSLKVWKGSPHWDQDPALSASNLVIADKDMALAQLLQMDIRWRPVYEDDISVVFVRNR